MRVDQVIFNLLFNSVCSFFAGILVVYLCLKIFRVNVSRWKLYFLTLPFVKILWDIGRGIPASSYMFHGIDPLSLPPKHGYLSIGAGFSEYGPILTLVFSVKDLAGKMYAASAADYLWASIVKKWHALAPVYILIFVFGISGALLFFRLMNYLRFEWERKKDRKTGSTTTLDKISLGRRSVDVYISENYIGTPFTGGVISPFICIPKATFKILNGPERISVIEHELAHIRSFDLPVTLAIKALGDIFWFVPGYRYLSNRIDRLREILADSAAVQSGSSPVHLASALVKLKDCEINFRHGVLYSAFFRDKSLLKVRVNRLIDETGTRTSPRFGWNNRYARALIIAWTTGGVMISAFGGNHELTTIPEWAEKLFRAWGLM